MEIFKEPSTGAHILAVRSTLDKLCVPDHNRSLQLPGFLFNLKVRTHLETEQGWEVGKLYGIHIYSSQRLPLRRLPFTLEERITILEGLLNVED